MNFVLYIIIFTAVVKNITSIPTKGYKTHPETIPNISNNVQCGKNRHYVNNKCECFNNHIEHNGICVEICPGACFNGDCVGDVCNCRDNFKLASNRRYCINTCKSCQNGICDEVKGCTCNLGYARINETCTPQCSRECVNGKCINPDVCQCQKGFQKTLDDFICRTACPGGCPLNSHCSGPDTCECDEFYLNSTAVIGKCVPDCFGLCRYGRCVAPNKCECPIGFILNDGECTPKCYQDCENGFCSANNQCTCNAGYKFSLQSRKCEFHCNFKCINGYCSGPGTCTCNDGFITNEENEQLCDPQL